MTAGQRPFAIVVFFPELHFLLPLVECRYGMKAAIEPRTLEQNAQQPFQRNERQNDSDHRTSVFLNISIRISDTRDALILSLTWFEVYARHLAGNTRRPSDN